MDGVTGMLVSKVLHLVTVFHERGLPVSVVHAYPVIPPPSLDVPLIVTDPSELFIADTDTLSITASLHKAYSKILLLSVYLPDGRYCAFDAPDELLHPINS